MKRYSPTQRLRQDLALLELKRQDDLVALKADFETAKEALHPMNLLKSLVGEGSEAGDALKSGIGKVAIGIGTGWLLKKLLFNAATRSPIMGLAGMLFQTAASGFIAKNSDSIQSGLGRAVSFLKDKLFHRDPVRDDPQPQQDYN